MTSRTTSSTRHPRAPFPRHRVRAPSVPKLPRRSRRRAGAPPRACPRATPCVDASQHRLPLPPREHRRQPRSRRCLRLPSFRRRPFPGWATPPSCVVAAAALPSSPDASSRARSRRRARTIPRRRRRRQPEWGHLSSLLLAPRCPPRRRPALQACPTSLRGVRPSRPRIRAPNHHRAHGPPSRISSRSGPRLPHRRPARLRSFVVVRAAMSHCRPS